MLQMPRLRLATEVSNGFHTLPPRPNSLSEPQNTRLPAQTVQLTLQRPVSILKSWTII
jgi:hypothetical protein